MLTCRDLLHVLAAAPLDHPPAGPLEDVQQVVVRPEAHQHLDGEGKNLRAQPQQQQQQQS
jgi:hypothetical protein